MYRYTIQKQKQVILLSLLRCQSSIFSMNLFAALLSPHKPFQRKAAAKVKPYFLFTKQNTKKKF